MNSIIHIAHTIVAQGCKVQEYIGCLNALIKSLNADEAARSGHMLLNSEEHTP